MARHTERPVETKEEGPMGGVRVTHPAFAQIQANRVNGRSYLYGSDFEHNGYITISIHPSVMMRSLSRDWPLGSLDEYIKVAMSNAQWAEFVSTMNSGMGTQCTLERLNRRVIPEITAPEDTRTEQAQNEMHDKTQAMVAKLVAARAEVEGMNITVKNKTALLDMIFRLHQELVSNIPYYMKSFGEHLETTVEKAKIEVNAYVESRIHRAGLDALNSGAPPIKMIESDTDRGSDS